MPMWTVNRKSCRIVTPIWHHITEFAQYLPWPVPIQSYQVATRGSSGFNICQTERKSSTFGRSVRFKLQSLFLHGETVTATISELSARMQRSPTYTLAYTIPYSPVNQSGVVCDSIGLKTLVTDEPDPRRVLSHYSNTFFMKQSPVSI
jgi:hypothetical protein